MNFTSQDLINEGQLFWQPYSCCCHGWWQVYVCQNVLYMWLFIHQVLASESSDIWLYIYADVCIVHVSTYLHLWVYCVYVDFYVQYPLMMLNSECIDLSASRPLWPMVCSTTVVWLATKSATCAMYVCGWCVTWWLVYLHLWADWSGLSSVAISRSQRVKEFQLLRNNASPSPNTRSKGFKVALLLLYFQHKIGTCGSNFGAKMFHSCLGTASLSQLTYRCTYVCTGVFGYTL